MDGSRLWIPANRLPRRKEMRRGFLSEEFSEKLSHWRLHKTVQLSALSYVATGGYSKPSLYPNAAYPLMRIVDRIADRIPFLFATRLLVVMEKN
jgi:hypothetical protein